MPDTVIVREDNLFAVVTALFSEYDTEVEFTVKLNVRYSIPLSYV